MRVKDLQCWGMSVKLSGDALWELRSTRAGLAEAACDVWSPTDVRRGLTGTCRPASGRGEERRREKRGKERRGNERTREWRNWVRG